MCVKEISSASFSPSNKVVNSLDSSLPENKIKDKKRPKSYQRRDKTALYERKKRKKQRPQDPSSAH